jgi:lysine biosynthesis protein LysW
MAMAFCLECGNTITLGVQPYEGQQVVCPKCRAHLEVVSLTPLQLDWVYEEELFKSDFEVPVAFSRGKVESYF